MAKRKAKIQKYTVTDGDLVLELERDDRGWFTVTSPFDPGLVTEAKTLHEAFEMARDAKKLLDEARAARLKKSQLVQA